jgi:hypothetical protein
MNTILVLCIQLKFENTKHCIPEAEKERRPSSKHFPKNSECDGDLKKERKNKQILKY